MKTFAEMDLSELVAPEGYDCDCGRHHACPMKYLKIAPGAITDVPEMLNAVGSRKPFLICDRNTFAAAGEQVAEILNEQGIPYALRIIPEREGKRISPAEWELGNLAFHFDPTCDFILGIGSGVINDLSKCLGRVAGVETGIIGTAPSMDGYASDSGSMEVDGIKCSVYGKAPAAILLDTDILAKAPARMLLAGFGDMIAKAVAICEWRISAMVTGEHYCSAIAEMTRQAVARVVRAAPGIPERKPEAIRAVAEGLVLSGIAMAYLGISRPASGLEHYFSHVWEMMAMEREKPYELHGIQVGIGTVLTLDIYREIVKLRPDRAVFESAEKAFDENRWRDDMAAIFGSRAGEIGEITRKAGLNDPEKRRRHYEILEARWDEVLKIIREELPDAAEMTTLAKDIGMMTDPAEIGIGAADIRGAFTGSRNLRDKYLTSTMLWDLGWSEQFAERY